MRRSFKLPRLCSALLCAFAVLFLQSCGWPQGVELGKRLIVEAVGIDLENGLYAVTLQALDTAAGGNSDTDKGGSHTRIYRFTGKTVGEALAKAPAATGLTPLYSQARLVVLGRKLAETDAAAPLDFFRREYNTRSDVLLAVGEPDAADIVRADLGSGVPDAVILEDAVLCGSENGACCKVKLFRFMNLLYSPTDTAYCPLVRLKNAPDGSFLEPDVCETAFFTETRLSFTSAPEITRGLLFLSGKTKKAFLTVKGKEGAYTLETIRVKPELRLRRKNGSITCGIQMKAVCDITEFSAQGIKKLGEAQAADARAAGKRFLTALLRDAFGFFYYDHRADVCRLQRLAQLRFPGKTKAFRENVFSRKAGITDIRVTLTIRRTGKESL